VPTGRGLRNGNRAGCGQRRHDQQRPPKAEIAQLSVQACCHQSSHRRLQARTGFQFKALRLAATPQIYPLLTMLRRVRDRRLPGPTGLIRSLRALRKCHVPEWWGWRFAFS
jgi:hypothetical protein